MWNDRDYIAGRHREIRAAESLFRDLAERVGALPTGAALPRATIPPKIITVTNRK